MEITLQILNELEKEGVIKTYALGGATALLFFAEPASTYDVDVFILLDQKPSTSLIDLTPLYESLKRKGYEADKEHFMIDGIPVQFIPAYNDLVEEGVNKAVIKDYQLVKTKVVSLEYLIAIMLDTYRPKDKERIAKLLEEGVEFDKNKLSEILSKYHLTEKWEKISGKME